VSLALTSAPLSHTSLILFPTSSPPLAEFASPRHYVDDADHIQPKVEEYEECKDEVWEQGVSVEPLENVELERSERKEVCLAVLFDCLLAQSILSDKIVRCGS
jgi:hypothetical protein